MGRARIGVRPAVIALAVVALMASSAAGVARAQNAEGGGEPAVPGFTTPMLIAPGKEPTLTVLHTGYVVGYLEPCGCKVNPAGGLARRAWLYDQIQSTFPGSAIVQLDVGNLSDTPTPAGDLRTTALVEGMNRLGFSAANVGERDLALGYDDFERRAGAAKFPFVSSNIVNRDTREPVFKPFVILETDVPGTQQKVRVGVLGVARFNPVFLKEGPQGSQMVILPPLEAVRRYIDEVRKNSDVVILMAAIHKDDAHILAREVEGLDMILGTYGAIYSTQAEIENDTVISYAGNQGRRVGETRVFLGKDNAIVDTQSYMHELNKRYPANGEIEEFVLQSLRAIKKAVGETEGAGADPDAPEPEASGAS